MSKDTEPMDYMLLAETVDRVRETVRAMVAGLMSDGFTEEQARSITAGFWALAGRPSTEEES